MADLFGDIEPAPRARKPKPSERPARAAAPRAPKFGTPEWDRCDCGAYAFFYFPLAGGLRRCMPCATAEGRWSKSPFPAQRSDTP